MYLNSVASTSSNEPPPIESDKNGFTERITSWIKGVQPTIPSSEGIVSRPTRRKTRRAVKPYTRPAAGVLHESHGSSSTDGSPVSLLPDPRQTVLDLRNASRIDRSLRSLPHPKDNPLITRCPDDLQEEYARIVLLYNAIEERKHPIEVRWLQRPSVATLKELDGIELASQRIIHAAQYIVDFSYSLRIDIDFQKIFLRYRSPPQNSMSGTQKQSSAAECDVGLHDP